MTETLPVEERIAILTKRLDNLNHSFTMDMETRLAEIARARLALVQARMELSTKPI